MHSAKSRSSGFRSAFWLIGALIVAGVLVFATIFELERTGGGQTASAAEARRQDGGVLTRQGVQNGELLRALDRGDNIRAAREAVATESSPTDRGVLDRAPEFIDLSGHRCRVEWDENVRKAYFENGQLASSSTFQGEQRDGEEMTWSPEGVLLSREMWREGCREGESEFFDGHGALLQKGAYKSNYREGPWVEYYPNSNKIYSSGSYKWIDPWNPQAMVGVWYFYGYNGELDEQRSGWYEEGRRVAPL